MASEVELERLVVRLIGDATDYRRMLQDTEQETKTAMGNIVSIVAQGAAALGGAQFLKGTFASFSEGEHVTLQLKAALEANQREVEATIADYEEFALQMQRSTTFSDEHIKTLLKTAETYNFTGDQAKQMVQQSMALAAATGGEAQMMMRLTAAVTRGNKEDLEHLEIYKRMIPQLRQAHSQEEQLEVIRRLTATGTKLLAAETETASGKLKQLNEEWDNAKEQMGAVVADAVTPLAAGLKEVVVWFQNTDPTVKTAVVSIIGLTAAVSGLKAVWTGLSAVGISGSFLGKASLFAGITVGVVSLTTSLVGATEEARKLEERLAAIEERTPKNVAKATGFGDVVMKTVGEAAPGERKGLIEAGILEAEDRANEIKRRLEAVKSLRDERLGGGFMQTARGVGGVLGIPDMELKELEADVKSLQKEFDAAVGVTSRLKNELSDADRVMKGDLTGKAKEDMRKLTEELQKQIDTWGMTASEAKLYALQVEHGLTPAAMEEAQALMDMHSWLEQIDLDYQKAQEDAKKMQDEVDGLTKSLEREIDVLMLGADAAKLKELAEQGVDEATLGHVAGLQEEKKFLEENTKMREKADEMLQRIADADPASKYESQIADLDKALMRGIINEDEYITILGLINDEYEDVTEGAHKAADEIKQLDAALSGSAEATQRVSDFYGKLADMYASTGKRANGAKKKGPFAGVKVAFEGGEGLVAQKEGVAGGAAAGGVAGLVKAGAVWERIEPLQQVMADNEEKQVKVLDDILKAIKDNGQQIIFEEAGFN